MITKRLAVKHRLANETALLSKEFENVRRGIYIENQGEWGSVEYGWHRRSNMARSGCGVIAAWNVLVCMGRIPIKGRIAFMSDLIRHFERRGAFIGGLAGTSFISVFLYLRERFPKTVLRPAFPGFLLDRFGKKHRVFVLLVLNDHANPLKGMHFICVTKDDSGFCAHNVYRKNMTGNFVASEDKATLSGAIREGGERVLPLLVIGVD